MGGEKEKAAETGSAPASSKKERQKKPLRTADRKKMMEKRRKQYRHLRTLLQISVRLINAFGRSGTIYRK